MNKERPLDPPEGEFEPREITDHDLFELAEKLLDKRLEKGGLAELIDELTNNLNDLSEFEANLWAYLRENDKALRYVAKKYIFKNSEKMEEQLQQEHTEEQKEKRDKSEGL
jgi:hypothetical protein